MNSSSFDISIKPIAVVAVIGVSACGWLLGAALLLEYLSKPSKKAAGPVHAVASTPPPWIQDDWRYTTQGWQNMRHWRARKKQTSNLSIDQFHPLTFTAVIFLASALGLVLTSSEQEADRLLGK